MNNENQLTKPSEPAEDQEVIEATVRWLERAVIGLDLCPFANAVHVKKQIRYVVSAATTPEALLDDLIRELETLAETSAEKIETTLLMHPRVLTDFLDCNDFLDVADETLEELDLADELQVATLHPQYQFADTQPDAIENYTNRSPYPTLHLVRTASLDHAIATFPEVYRIVDKNNETMRNLGHAGWEALWEEPQR